MKKLSILFTILCAPMAMAANSVLAPVDHLYVPRGFDNNDSVEVVVAGYFPSPCYSRDTVKVEVKKNIININVNALINAEDMGICPEMTIPYQEVVSLGNLQAGDYKLTVNGQSPDSLQEELKVTEAGSNAIDDHVYAAINSVVRSGDDGVEFIFKGEEYSDCFKLDRFEFVSNGKDTVSVLPIMKQVKKFCLMKGKSMEYKVRVDFVEMQTDRPLLHVRTLDGKSINTIVNFRGPLK